MFLTAFLLPKGCHWFCADFGSLGPRIERDHGRYLAAVLCDKELKARDKADNIVQELQESEQHYKERMRRVSSSEWEILSKTIRIHAPVCPCNP